MSSDSKRFAGKSVAVLLLVVAVGIGVYFAARTRPAPVVSHTPVQPAAVEPAPAPEPSARPEVEPQKPAPQPLPRTEQVATTEPVEKRPAHDMTGVWDLSVQGDDGAYESVARLDVKHTEAELTASVQPRGDKVEISLSGMKLNLKQKLNARVQYTFEGMMDSGYQHADGTFDTLMRPSDDSGQDVKTSYSAHFARVTNDMLQREKLAGATHNERIDDAKAIYEALKRFADRNNGAFPATLSQLPASDLPDPSIIAPATGRSITYSGSGKGNVDNETLKAVFEEYNDKQQTREGLMELERRLHEVWGSDVPASGSILTIEYDDPPLTITVGPSGNVSSSGPDVSDPVNANASSALRASEYNNMKQLMLVVKMFQNEHRDELIPPGWLTVYPEYLTDPSILRSPWVPNGTISYDLVFPGSTQAEVLQLALDLRESGALGEVLPAPDGATDPAILTRLPSEIPAIVSRELLPMDPGQSPARAVAFLDGHVEGVPLSDWDRRIAPYLR